MNPQLQSALTTFLGYVATTIAGYAVTVGVVPAGSKADFVNALVTVGSAIVAAGVLWWKSRRHTPTALVAEVNGPAVPGVKVVAAGSPSQPVAIDPKTGKPIPLVPPIA